jgi:hypothetical protein
MDLTKYVRFTPWYNSDLLVLAHYEPNMRRAGRDVLRPKNKRYFLVLRCTSCDTYDRFPFWEPPTDDYIRAVAENYETGERHHVFAFFRMGYHAAADGTLWLRTEDPPDPAYARLMPYKHHRSICQRMPLEEIAVPNYFMIQAGAIRRERVLLPDSSPWQIRYACP